MIKHLLKKVFNTIYCALVIHIEDDVECDEDIIDCYKSVSNAQEIINQKLTA